MSLCYVEYLKYCNMKWSWLGYANEADSASWWKSSVLELFLWVVKEKLVNATTLTNIHNENQLEHIPTEEKQNKKKKKKVSHFLVAFFTCKNLSFLSANTLTVHTTSNPTPLVQHHCLYSEMEKVFLACRWQRKLLLWKVETDDFIYMLTELLKTSGTVGSPQSVQIIFQIS